MKKPKISFDLESTSTDADTARIVQIAAIKKFPDGTTEVKDILINPEIPIPKAASDVHGITDEMVKDAPTFAQLAVSMEQWFHGCDLCGFNSDSYDVPLLNAEMERAGVEFLTWNPNYVDVRKVFQKLYPNTLGDIYKRFLEKDLEGAHDALIDIKATDEILDYMLAHHPELELDSAEKIDLFCQGDKKRVDLAGKMYEDENGVIRWSFSKNKDLPVNSDFGFCNWVLGQNFPQETKNKVKEIMKTKTNE